MPAVRLAHLDLPRLQGEERRRAVPARDPQYPFTSVSTFDLLMSSLMMVLALAAVQRGDMKWGKIWLFSTALLGLVFLGGQVIEFTEFVHKGLTISTNLFGCTFFVLTEIGRASCRERV